MSNFGLSSSLDTLGFFQERRTSRQRSNLLSNTRCHLLFYRKKLFFFSSSVRKKKKKKIFSGSTVGIDREAVIAAFDSPDCNCLLNVSVEEANNNFDKRECLPGNRYWASQHEIGAHTHLYITIDCHAHEPRVNNMFPARPIRSLNVGGRFISIDFALFA